MIQKMTDEYWDAIVGVHLTVPFKISRAAEFIRAAFKREGEAGQEVFAR